MSGGHSRWRSRGGIGGTRGRCWRWRATQNRWGRATKTTCCSVWRRTADDAWTYHVMQTSQMTSHGNTSPTCFKVFTGFKTHRWCDCSSIFFMVSSGHYKNKRSDVQSGKQQLWLKYALSWLTDWPWESRRPAPNPTRGFLSCAARASLSSLASHCALNSDNKKQYFKTVQQHCHPYNAGSLWTAA